MMFNSLQAASGRRPRGLAGLGPALGQRAGLGDKAAGLSLAEKFGPRVEEVVIDNGHRAHAPEPYLNASPTGAAIAHALARPEA